MEFSLRVFASWRLMREPAVLSECNFTQRRKDAKDRKGKKDITQPRVIDRKNLAKSVRLRP